MPSYSALPTPRQTLSVDGRSWRELALRRHPRTMLTLCALVAPVATTRIELSTGGNFVA
jgi:hypothetical protein